MDASSHNLLEPYYHDGVGGFYYKSLMSGSNYFTVRFTRAIVDGAVDITITQIEPDGEGPAATEQDVTFLEAEIEKIQGIPLNGDECVALGWTYLGNWNTNQANIANAISACEAQGHKFQPIFYHKGYFVHGCVADKLFYDLG